MVDISSEHNQFGNFERFRVLDRRQTLQFTGISDRSWKRLVAARRAPAPIRLGLKKCGWVLGDLVDWIKSKQELRE